MILTDVLPFAVILAEALGQFIEHCRRALLEAVRSGDKVGEVLQAMRGLLVLDWEVLSECGYFGLKLHGPLFPGLHRTTAACGGTYGLA